MKRKTFEGTTCVRQRLCCVGLLMAAGAASIAQAQDLDAPRFTLRGFGTAAATTHDTDDIEFRRSASQGHGVAANDIEMYTDSIAGVQFNARLSSKFDFVLQGVSRQHADGDWDVEMSQGFVRFSPDQSWVLRAGRLGYDIYLLAESRQVGYSYLALRPSPEFYGLLTNDQIDGADIAFTRRVGSGLVRARVFGGDGAGELAFSDGTFTNPGADVYGAVLDYLNRGWTARVALVKFDYESGAALASLAAALRMTGAPESVAIADGLDHKVLSSTGLQLGIAYEDGPLQSQVLYAISSSDSIAGPDLKALYTLVGYRLHDFTPYASFASSRDDHAARTTGLPDIPMLAPLNGAVAAIQAPMRSTQDTTSVGVRFDVSSHFDVKLQVDRVSLRGSSLNFDRRTPAGSPANMTVVAVAVDFVF
jgi:hypothetical protein